MYLCVGTECEWILYFNCREGKGYCKIKVLVRFETRARIIDTEHLNVILKLGLRCGARVRVRARACRHLSLPQGGLAKLGTTVP